MRSILLWLLLAATCSAQSDEANDYFNSLVSEPETIGFLRLRTQAEINQNTQFDYRGGDNPQVTYDPDFDAARVHMPAHDDEDGTLLSRNQIRFVHPPVRSGTVLYTWDWRFAAEWLRHRGRVEILKSFQLANTVPAESFTMTHDKRAGRFMKPGNRRIEIRHFFESKPHFTNQLKPNDAAFSDLRIDYIDGRNNGDSGGVPVDKLYTVKPEVWQRFWVLVDLDAKTLDLWIADEQTDPVQVYSKVVLPRLTGYGDPNCWGLDSWWLEFHGTIHRTGPATTLGWLRNPVVQRDARPNLQRPAK